MKSSGMPGDERSHPGWNEDDEAEAALRLVSASSPDAAAKLELGSLMLKWVLEHYPDGDIKVTATVTAGGRTWPLVVIIPPLAPRK